MTNFVVLTTIFQPTDAILRLASNCDNYIIVAGDRKTPENWSIKNAAAKVDLIKHDCSIGSKLEKVLPFNHYSRKMLGYIFAANNGANVIYETDDDNYPKDNWYMPDFASAEKFVAQDRGFVNIYKYFSDSDIWPRGFPLELINDEKSVINENELQISDLKIGIYQGLVDNEPDVDAIYRLLKNNKCVFDNKPSLALSKGTICPFNSQNTFTRRELFPLLYLPSTVTFRFTDILRGLIAQPLMWNEGFHLCFTKATAIQERNVHNYLKDFESEIPCYLLAQRVVNIAINSIKPANSLKDNMFSVYESLLAENIVKKEELNILQAWLEDIS